MNQLFYFVYENLQTAICWIFEFRIDKEKTVITTGPYGTRSFGALLTPQ